MHAPFGTATPVVRLTPDVSQIAQTINAFSRGYHTDFFRVRAIGRQYLAHPQPKESTVADLTKALREVLRNWGAGGRAAPRLREPHDFQETLLDPTVHTRLVSLSHIQIPNLSITNTTRCLNKDRTDTTLVSFDTTLLGTLHLLASRLFHGCTNVTYPMKVLLLITGLMPALDGNVRGGLHRGGFAGMSTTQFLLADTTQSANGKKLTRLPFLLGQCWSAFLPQFLTGIQHSQYPELVEEPGRVFDILLFMQARTEVPVLSYAGGNALWYDLQ